MLLTKSNVNNTELRVSENMTDIEKNRDRLNNIITALIVGAGTLITTLVTVFFSLQVTDINNETQMKIADMNNLAQKQIAQMQDNSAKAQSDANLRTEFLQILLTDFYPADLSKKQSMIKLFEATYPNEFSEMINVVKTVADESLSAEEADIINTQLKDPISIFEKEQNAYNLISSKEFDKALINLTDVYSKYPTLHNVSEVLKVFNQKWIDNYIAASDNKKKTEYEELLKTIIDEYSWGLKKTTLANLKTACNDSAGSS